MRERARDRVEFHIEEYGSTEDRAKYILHPAKWPRVERCLDIISKERVTKGRNLKVLDVGCSDGTVSKIIADMGNRVYGIDVIPHLVEKTKAKGIEAIVGDVEKGLPYEDGFFDVVHAAVLLEHIFDTEFFLGEAKRVLVEDGLLIVSVPNICTLPNRIRLLFGYFPKFVAPAQSWRLGGHVRAFSAGALNNILENCGFKVERMVGNYVSFFPKFYSVRPWSETLGKLFPTFSEVIVASARSV